MNLTQTGYLGNVGPVFVDTTTVPGKAIVLVGTIGSGGITLNAKAPQYAQNLQSLGPFPYSPSQCTLGSYSDNQPFFFADINYKIPSTGGNSFSNYRAVESSWFAYSINNGQTSAGSNPSTTAGLGGSLPNLTVPSLGGSTTTTPTKGLANSGIGAALAALAGQTSTVKTALANSVPIATFKTKEEAEAKGYTLANDSKGQLVYVPISQAGSTDNTMFYWLGFGAFALLVILATRNRDEDDSYRRRYR